MNGFKNAHAGIIAVLAMALVSINRRLPVARRLSTGITTLTLAGIVLLVAAGGASAAPCGPGTANPVCACGDTVMASYIFPGNLDCSGAPANQPGLYIGASGITIDGAGYTMIGNRSAAACNVGIVPGGAPPNDNNPALHSGIANAGGVNNNYNNVVIKNLKIREFCTGIALGDLLNRDVDFNEVTNCRIYDCGNLTTTTHGIHMVHTNYSTITNNTIHHIDGPGDPGGCSAGGNGIFLYGDMNAKGEDNGNNNTITYNNLTNNTKSGFFTKHMCQYNNISYNNATWNDQGGITLRCVHSSYSTVSYNNATGNGIWGIYIGGYNNSVYNNTANETGNGKGAGTGICLCRDASDNNDIRNNTACWNDGDGICIVAAGTGNTLYDNTFCFNGGYDINNIDAAIGNNNTCDSTFNYEDNDAIAPYPCVFQCPCDISNLRVTNKTEKWVVQGVNYTINYTVCNVGKLVSSEGWTEIYINGISMGVDPISIPVLAPGICEDRTFVGPFNINAPGDTDTIRLWADSTDTTVECQEIDNNRTNLFGGANLKIIDLCGHPDWINPSLRMYNVTYAVKNIGDNDSRPCWVNFTELNGDWKDCVDPVPVPVLAPGESTGMRNCTLVMGDDSDWIEAWVNFDQICPVKVWNVLHHDRDRREWDYMGPCLGCGDVDSTGYPPNTIDITLLRNKVRNLSGVTLTCEWGGDVDSTGYPPNTIDITLLRNKVRNLSGVTLDCCEGCCPP
jgi:parallel beta-helix repeat protein